MSCRSSIASHAFDIPSRPPWAMLLGGLGLAAALAASPAAMAGHHQHDHGGHHGAAEAEHDPDEHAGNPAVQAYREASERMHAGMSAQFTGDADIDFARGMIPHHRGAIDMANIVLEHGEDEEIRQLAREIIEAQEREIAFLARWLEEHGD